MVRLVLTDIDSTIMPEGASRVPDHVIEAFHALQDAGIVVAVVTGRGFDWVPRFFGGDERCCSTMVATNGLQVYLEGEMIHEEHLDHGALCRVLDIVRELPRAGMLCFDGGTPLLVHGSRDDLAWAMPPYAPVCVEVDGLPGFPLVKGNAFAVRDEDGTRELVARLNREVAGLDFDFPRPGLSNIMPAGKNKGTGARVLAQALGIGMDEVVAFGDAGNDLAMFDAVEHSVCVSNGTDEAKAAARWHIGSCEDGAVSAAMQALARGEWPFTE